MTKVDVYNSDYTKVNHAYILIYNAYEKLIQCPDYDEEVLAAMENFLRTFNPLLDRMKSEMTVQTRYKEEPSSQDEKTQQMSGGETSDGGSQNIKHISLAPGFSSAEDAPEEDSGDVKKGKILRGFFTKKQDEE